ncbi:MAG: hypothetical protein VYE22_32165 [Myxococcota bacterium]|nr:hypothetical protein [Myxococcota bacterium]
MKLTHWTTLFAIIAMLGFVTACEEEAESTETPATEAPPEEAAEEAEEAAEEMAEEAEEAADEMAEGAEGGDDACSRARACCTAFVEASNSATPGAVSAETACAGVQNLQGAAAEAACNAAIDGWRQSLTAMNAEVPDSCAAGE